MDQSISSLAFKGSINEAINEAKRQKKLFVVYISGENEDSIAMDKSTWTESSVAESLSKYCILLHILEGSTDAAQFSAIYPQKPAPCITAIGYNGVQLWQNDGFVSAEVLSSTLEKSWLSLHVQETTATFLTAALASRQSEQIPSQAREVGSYSTSSINTNASASVDKKDSDIDKEKSENRAPLVEENSKRGGDVSHGPSADKLEESNVKQPVTTTNKPISQVTPRASEPGVNEATPSNVKQPVTTTNKPINQATPTASVPGVDPKRSLNVGQNEAKPEKSEKIETEKADNSDLGSHISTDIYLNIRLPDDASLHEKFEPTSTLKMVKDYVEENQESSIGSYDLAIPYPRKVFSDQELSLLNRQALIVVPHLKGLGPNRGRSSISNPSASVGSTGSSDGESYFSLVRRYMSYVNPLAYLGGGGGDAAAANSSTSGQETRSILPESDLRKTLTELSLLNRQALIVVPHLKGSGPNRGRPSIPNPSASVGLTGSSDGESYFSLVRRYLSYVNPLAYLGGGGDAAANSSTSGLETRRILPESGTPQGNFTGSRRSYLVTSNQSSNTPSTAKNNKPNPSRFGSGSNIHTLKHDEDDAQFKGQNAFWNGNSTEYGGDGDNK